MGLRLQAHFIFRCAIRKNVADQQNHDNGRAPG